MSILDKIYHKELYAKPAIIQSYLPGSGGGLSDFFGGTLYLIRLCEKKKIPLYIDFKLHLLGRHLKSQLESPFSYLPIEIISLSQLCKKNFKEMEETLQRLVDSCSEPTFVTSLYFKGIHDYLGNPENLLSNIDKVEISKNERKILQEALIFSADIEQRYVQFLKSNHLFEKRYEIVHLALGSEPQTGLDDAKPIYSDYLEAADAVRKRSSVPIVLLSDSNELKKLAKTKKLNDLIISPTQNGDFGKETGDPPLATNPAIFDDKHFSDLALEMRIIKGAKKVSCFSKHLLNSGLPIWTSKIFDVLLSLEFLGVAATGRELQKNKKKPPEELVAPNLSPATTQAAIFGERQKLVIFTWWNDKEKDQEKALSALRNNLNNFQVDEVHVFRENLWDQKHQEFFLDTKISFSIISPPLTAKAWMKYADKNYPTDIKILAPPDTYFDGTISKIRDQSFLPDTLYVFTPQSAVPRPVDADVSDLSGVCCAYQQPTRKSFRGLKKEYVPPSNSFAIFSKPMGGLIEYPQLTGSNRKLSPSRAQILIKIPSYKRPDQLLETVRSFELNKSGEHQIRFLITVDETDQDTNNPEFLKKLNQISNATVIFAQSKSKIDAYNHGVNAEELFDILVVASDDMLVTQTAYDQTIVENMVRFFPDTDGVLWFDTGENEITNTLPILGRSYFERFNWVYNQQYCGYYCDDEFTRVAFKLGKMVKINESIIKHNIPPHLKMSDDQTYLKSLVFGPRDKALYKIRRKVQFDCGEIEPTQKSDFGKKFFDVNRNQNEHGWFINTNKYDDPISPSEVYILEQADQKVIKMDIRRFEAFASTYFRNYRYRIPPIIHQIWLGEKKPEIEEMMSTFSVDYLEKHAGWRYILWDEKKLDSLQMINRDLFEKEHAYDCKSDIARLEILNKFGGVYLDSDFIWLKKKPLSSLFHLADRGILLFYEKAGEIIGNRYLNQKTTRCNNAFFGASMANPIIAFLIGQLRDSYEKRRREGVVATTGPDFLQPILEQLKIKISSHKYVHPIWWCKDPDRNPDYEKLMEVYELSGEKIASMFPEAVIFHKGWHK